jgi:hypothetical protein
MRASVESRRGYSGVVTMATTSAETLAALCAALRGQVVAGVRIHEARAEVKPGSDDEPIVRLTLLVDDPKRGRDTWAVETVRAIEGRARREAWSLGMSEWVYVTLIGLGEAAEEDEDPAADEALSRGLSREFDR